jgi:hypothetical protein
MSELLKDISDIIKHDQNAVDSVRRVLKSTKAKHNDTNTRDLNSALQVPGYKYVKRNNVIFLDKDYASKSAQNLKARPELEITKSKPVGVFLNKPQKSAVIDMDDSEESEEIEDPKPESAAKLKTIKQRQAQTLTQPQRVDINEQVLSLAKNHAQQIAQAQADEQAKSISQSLISALNNNSQINNRAKEGEEFKLPLMMREEEQKREQKLREESQLTERLERQTQQKAAVEEKATLEELMQSLAQRHAEQMAKEQTQKQAQTIMQKLAQTLYQDQTKTTEESPNEKQIHNAQLIRIIGLLLEHNEDVQVKLTSLKVFQIAFHFAIDWAGISGLGCRIGCRRDASCWFQGGILLI